LDYLPSLLRKISDTLSSSSPPGSELAPLDDFAEPPSLNGGTCCNCICRTLWNSFTYEKSVGSFVGNMLETKTEKQDFKELDEKNFNYFKYQC
jgi:hypothetical protein